MPRRHRIGTPGFVYHVLNRANRRDTLFCNRSDFAAFEKVLFEATARFDMALLDYAIMRNHFHLIVQPSIERQLSRFMHWLTTTHTQRWHATHGTAGTGSLYQGRFKALPIQSDRHFLAVVRYVHRNPVRAGLVGRAEQWRWSGAWRIANNRHNRYLAPWPVTRPVTWFEWVNEMPSEAELSDIREAITRSAPFGDTEWARATAAQLGILHTGRRGGRPSHRENDSRPLFE